MASGRVPNTIAIVLGAIKRSVLHLSERDAVQKGGFVSLGFYLPPVY